jgi:hypothetical protein
LKQLYRSERVSLKQLYRSERVSLKQLYRSERDRASAYRLIRHVFHLCRSAHLPAASVRVVAARYLRVGSPLLLTHARQH